MSENLKLNVGTFHVKISRYCHIEVQLVSEHCMYIPLYPFSSKVNVRNKRISCIIFASAFWYVAVHGNIKGKEFGKAIVTWNASLIIKTTKILHLKISLFSKKMP